MERFRIPPEFGIIGWGAYIPPVLVKYYLSSLSYEEWIGNDWAAIPRRVRKKYRIVPPPVKKGPTDEQGKVIAPKSLPMQDNVGWAGHSMTGPNRTLTIHKSSERRSERVIKDLITHWFRTSSFSFARPPARR